MPDLDMQDECLKLLKNFTKSLIFIIEWMRTYENISLLFWLYTTLSRLKCCVITQLIYCWNHIEGRLCYWFTVIVTTVVQKNVISGVVFGGDELRE